MQSEPTAADLLVAHLTRGREWMQKAKCRTIDLPLKERVGLFFPYRGTSRAQAKACCAACPVKVQCDAYAKETRSLGMWAGKMRAMYPKDE